MLPGGEFRAELVLVVTRARAAGIGPESESRGAGHSAEHVASLGAIASALVSHRLGWAETASLPGGYRMDGGIPRFFVAVCQPTAKAARLVTGTAFIGFRSTQTVGGWVTSLKGRDGLA